MKLKAIVLFGMTMNDSITVVMLTKVLLRYYTEIEIIELNLLMASDLID